ncbi:hypothetical protein [Ammoniphilus sp. 3BR4]|uniref:hypothetical protein n=1 Tax=Ammoniphilus sp. 3BR4 TaxID=3158265 RepID=UPI0034675986
MKTRVLNFLENEANSFSISVDNQVRGAFAAFFIDFIFITNDDSLISIPPPR